MRVSIYIIYIYTPYACCVTCIIILVSYIFKYLNRNYLHASELGHISWRISRPMHHVHYNNIVITFESAWLSYFHETRVSPSSRHRRDGEGGGRRREKSAKVWVFHFSFFFFFNREVTRRFPRDVVGMQIM